MCDRLLSLLRHWWWWEAQPSIFARRSTTMLIIGIVLAFVALAYLCWLLFALAVYALPFFAGLSAGLAAYRSGSGPIGAIIVGVVTGAVTLLLGQVAFAKVRSPLIRTAVALFFAAPAALAGYHAALGLASVAIPGEGWRDAIAILGAIIVAVTAWIRIALFATHAGRVLHRLSASAPSSSHAVVADNDVIVHLNFERLGDVNDRLGHVDVSAREGVGSPERSLWTKMIAVADSSSARLITSRG